MASACHTEKDGEAKLVGEASVPSMVHIRLQAVRGGDVK